MTRRKVTRHSYLGFLVHQRREGRNAFFVFVASVKDVMNWSVIDRLEERQGGVQRRLNEAKTKAITRFLQDNTENTVPNSIIVAFSPDTTTFEPISSDEISVHMDGVTWGHLSFTYDPKKESERPAFVVDGQHRLHGLYHVKKEEIPVVVTALIDADTNEQAFQFIIINNKASKVAPDLVRSLIADFDEEGLSIRLKTARVSLRGATLVAVIDDEVDSPFRQMIAWERRRLDPPGILQPSAVESSLAYMKRRFVKLEDDDDSLIEFFFTVWTAVKEAYPKLWKKSSGQYKESNLFSNAGFRAFTEYMVDKIESRVSDDDIDLDSSDELKQIVKKICTKIPSEFWLLTWSLKSLDTSAGREILKDDLRRIQQNPADSWNRGLRVLPTSDNSD